MVGQKIIGPLVAEKFDIPLVIYGENPAEDGNLIEENFDPRILIFFHKKYKRNTSWRSKNQRYNEAV